MSKRSKRQIKKDNTKNLKIKQANYQWIVKRVEYGNIYLDLGKAEAFMRKDDTIPREVLGQEIELELL